MGKSNVVDTNVFIEDISPLLVINNNREKPSKNTPWGLETALAMVKHGNANLVLMDCVLQRVGVLYGEPFLQKDLVSGMSATKARVCFDEMKGKTWDTRKTRKSQKRVKVEKAEPTKEQLELSDWFETEGEQLQKLLGDMSDYEKALFVGADGTEYEQVKRVEAKAIKGAYFTLRRVFASPIDVSSLKRRNGKRGCPPALAIRADQETLAKVYGCTAFQKQRLVFIPENIKSVKQLCDFLQNESLVLLVDDSGKADVSMRKLVRLQNDDPHTVRARNERNKTKKKNNFFSREVDAEWLNAALTLNKFGKLRGDFYLELVDMPAMYINEHFEFTNVDVERARAEFLKFFPGRPQEFISHLRRGGYDVNSYFPKMEANVEHMFDK